MKKLLLGTAAALSLTSAAAQAGPALDTLTTLLPTDARVTFDAQTADSGQEIYEGLEYQIAGNTTRFEQARLSLDAGVFGLEGQGVLSTDPDGTTTRIDEVSFLAPLALFDLETPPGGAQPDLNRFGEEVCGTIQAPLSVSADGILVNGFGVIASARLDASVQPLDGVCTLDIAQSVSGVDIVPEVGPGVRIGDQQLRGRTALMMGLPETLTGETYGSTMSIRDVEMSLNGKPQLKISEIEATSSLDADSAITLASAGYNRHIEALTLGLSEMRAPAEQLPYADLWNGARALNTQGSVRLKGAEVVGEEISELIPIPGLLDPGARLDLELSMTKMAELLELALKVDGSNTLLLDLIGAVRIDAADPSFNTLSPRALIMAAPVSVVSASARVSDRGVGAVGEQVIGMDPYALIAPSLGGLIGEANATRLSDWVAGARDGGEARISADPAQPVPVLMLGMLALGDWAALGQMLNVSR